MQNLYMMATLVREQQMQKMAIEIITGKISIVQAMANYNVATEEAVLNQLESYKTATKRPVASNERASFNLKTQAA